MTDDEAIDKFAEAMKAKMRLAKSKGRGGWETCSPDKLRHEMLQHIVKGDPVDVANYAMMLHTMKRPTNSPVIELSWTIKVPRWDYDKTNCPSS